MKAMGRTSDSNDGLDVRGPKSCWPASIERPPPHYEVKCYSLLVSLWAWMVSLKLADKACRNSRGMGVCLVGCRSDFVAPEGDRGRTFAIVPASIADPGYMRAV
jgi:hypothetical protein